MNKREHQEQELQRAYSPRLATKQRIKPEQSRLVLNFYSGKMEPTTIVSLAASPVAEGEGVPEHFDLSDSQCCN